MKTIAVLLLLTIASAVATASTADPFAHPVSGEALLTGILAAPAARLAEVRQLSGRFTHQKHLSEIPRPLTSTGDFIFARDLGVYWHTRKPLDSAVVLTSAGIFEIADGSQGMRLSADDQPAVRMVAQVFLALFTLDLTRLERDFKLFAVSEGARWTLGLEPRGAAMAAVFTRAMISGAAAVEQVVLFDVRGDRTVIGLAGIEYSNSAVDARTRELFIPPGT